MTENQAPTPNVQINAQYIKDLSFEAPQMPFILSEMAEPPQFNIGIDINVSSVNKEQKIYAVELVVKADAKLKEKPSFVCELTYGAVVTLNLPEEHVKPILLIEIPHLLFPYVRAIISNTTREAGLPPLSLNPIDFASLYRDRMAQEKPQEEKVN